MLPKTTLERLQSFKLTGFVDALITQMSGRQYQDLSFEDRLTLLIDSEYTRRLDARTRRMLKDAKLPNSATIEELDFSIQRGLQKRIVLELAQGNWLSQGTNLIITGQTGTGKTYLGSAIAHSLIIKGFTVRFQRSNHWMADLQSYAERSRLPQTVTVLRRVPLLVFDEWLLDPITSADGRRLLELFQSRETRYSCMFLTQLPVSAWHSRFEDPTTADAILDRLVHNSVRIELLGESLRKLRAPDTSLYQGENVASLRQP
jgi:DNA replication protein DnaC